MKKLLTSVNLRIRKLKREKPHLYKWLWKSAAVGLGLVLFLALWALLARLTTANVVPGLKETARELGRLLGDYQTYRSLFYTLARLALALLAAGLLGIIFGALAGFYPFIEYVLKPMVTVLRSFPSIALLLILIIYSKNAEFYLVAIVLFPLIYEATLRGVSAVKAEYRDVLALDGGNRLVNLPRIGVPLAGEYIAVGLLQSIGLGLKVQIMGESLMGSTTYIGLGSSIYKAYLNLETARVFALALLAIFFVFLADLLTLAIKRHLKNRLLQESRPLRR